MAFAAPVKATFRVGKVGAGKSIFRVAKKAPPVVTGGAFFNHHRHIHPTLRILQER